MKKARLSSLLTLSSMAVFAFASSAAPASAQNRDDCRCFDRSGDEIENCSCFGVNPQFQWRGFAQQANAQPRIGISVDAGQSARNDARGARVTALMEDGPADEAGIRTGDVITSVDGHSLFDALAGDAEGGFDLDSSIPVQRLLAITAELEPGQEVEIEYLRGTEAHTTTVEAEELSSWGDSASSFNFDFARPTLGGNLFRHGVPEADASARSFQLRPDSDEMGQRVQEFTERVREEARRSMIRLRSGRGADLEVFYGPDAPRVIVGDHQNLYGNLLSMSMGQIHGIELMEMKPGLAAYFGAEDGMLVTNVDEDSTLGLEPGDVILGIGDRAATSSSRIRRILSTYDEDEEITLRIMRDHDEITVTGRLGG